MKTKLLTLTALTLLGLSTSTAAPLYANSTHCCHNKHCHECPDKIPGIDIRDEFLQHHRMIIELAHRHSNLTLEEFLANESDNTLSPMVKREIDSFFEEIYKSVLGGDIEHYKTLIDNYPVLDEKFDGVSLLMTLVFMGHVEASEYLLEKGIDPNYEFAGKTILDLIYLLDEDCDSFSIGIISQEMVDMLIAHGAVTHLT